MKFFFWTTAVQKKIELIFHFFSKFLSCNSAQKIAVLFWVCRGVSLSVCCNQVQSYPWDMRQCRVRSKRRQKKWQTEKRKKCRPDGNWTLASANTVNSLCILGSWVQIPDMTIFFPSFFSFFFFSFLSSWDLAGPRYFYITTKNVFFIVVESLVTMRLLFPPICLFLVFRDSVNRFFNHEKSETANFWRHFWNPWVILRQVGIKHIF